MGYNDEPVPIDYDEFVTETDAACLYRIDGGECWIPKSVHEHDDDSKQKVIWVKQWFCEKEELV